MVHCRSLLASFKIPRRLQFLDGELPKNGAGKVSKKELRQRFLADPKDSLRG